MRQFPLPDQARAIIVQPVLNWRLYRTAFMPFAFASNEGVVSDLHVHILEVMTLSMAGVLASFQLRRTLRLSHEPVLAAILTFFGTVLFVYWGLNGFIDALAAGLAVTGIYWMQRDLPGRALLALAAGLSPRRTT